MTEKYLSRPEEIVLLAVWKLGENAYGLGIRNFAQELTGKYWSVGAVYVPLERLEKRGFLSSHTGDPRPERGGRRRRLFQLTRAGRRELDELSRVNAALWRDYPRVNPGNNT
jgi:DNA-binding PadR family transcriptional regulator